MKKRLWGSPVRPLWYLSNAFVGAWPRPIIHRASSTEIPPRPCRRLVKLYVPSWTTRIWKKSSRNLIKNPRVRSRIVHVNLLVWWLRSTRFRARSRVRTPPCTSELFARSAKCLPRRSSVRTRRSQKPPFFDFFIFTYVHAWPEAP